MKRHDEAANAFSALGNPKRLAVLRLLVRAGDDGMNVTAIRELLDIPASTLTHHLETLASAGLLTQEKMGRDLVSTADFAVIKRLSAYLLKDCCVGAARPKRSA